MIHNYKTISYCVILTYSAGLFGGRKRKEQSGVEELPVRLQELQRAGIVCRTRAGILLDGRADRSQTRLGSDESRAQRS